MSKEAPLDSWPNTTVDFNVCSNVDSNVGSNVGSKVGSIFDSIFDLLFELIGYKSANKYFQRSNTENALDHPTTILLKYLKRIDKLFARAQF